MDGLFGMIGDAGNWLKDTLGEGYDMIMGSEDTMLPEKDVNKQQNVTFGNSSEGGSNRIDPIMQNDINTAVSDDEHSLLDGAMVQGAYAVPNVINMQQPPLEPGHSGGFGTFRGPWSPEEYEKHEKERKDWADAGDSDKWIDEEEWQWRQGKWREEQRLENLKREKAQKTGKVLNAFSDAFGKMRSDLRDPYVYDSSSIFGKGINS